MKSLNRHGSQGPMFAAIDHESQYGSAQIIPAESPEEGSRGIPFSQFLYGFRRHAWKVAAFCGVCVLLTYVVCKRITPVYEAVVSLEIDRQSPSGVVGADAARSAWNDSDQYIATQIKVIQADSVLRPVARRFALVPEAEDSTSPPVKLKDLKVLRPPNTYLVQINYRSADRVAAANVANAIAASYLEHVFRSRLQDTKSQTTFMERQLDELRASMEKSTMAVSEYEKKLGVIDPQGKTDILSARLLQLNTEYTNVQADRIKKEADYYGVRAGTMQAAQVSDQGEGLKRLQDSLNEATQKFVEIKEHFGPKHPEYLRQSSLIEELQSQLDNAKRSVMDRAQVSYRNSVQREQMLRQELSQTKASYDDLNAKSYQYQTLKIEAESSRKLYNDLEQRIKEAGINANFQNSTAHITDAARPAKKPVSPDIPLSMGLALGLSFLIGSAATILYDAADDTLQDSSQIASLSETGLLGVVPVMREQKGLLLFHTGQADDAVTDAAAEAYPIPRSTFKKTDAFRYTRYDEAIRMLWSSFQLTNMGSKYRSVMVTSAISGEGKTTLSSQLALANARHNQRTLLIDTDLRRPSVHRSVGLTMTPGLADAIHTPDTWRAFVRPAPMSPNLHVMTGGVAQRGSLDQLIQFLPLMLAEAEDEYDMVIIDSPPLLAFADSLHLATAVDGVLVVACADKTSRRALLTVIRTLHRLRANVAGIVLNRAPDTEAGGYYNYAHYQNTDLGASA